MPEDYCTNELLTYVNQGVQPTSIDVPYFKDLLKLLIVQKCREIKNQITHEEQYINKRTGLFNQSYKAKESKRDDMKKDYFETIDERIFLECSV